MVDWESEQITQRLMQMDRFVHVEYEARGSFGYVFRVHDALGQQLAVKILEVASLNENPAVMRRFVFEVVNHSKLSGHAHIVQFKYIFLTPGGAYVGIAMEYADVGTLLQYARFNPTNLNRETFVRRLFQQLILAVAYCHAKGVANRDLKLGNTLIVTSNMQGNGPSHLLKICDFGYSKNTDVSGACSLAGTYGYLPPEVAVRVRNPRFSSAVDYDGKAADIWQCGVMLFYLMYLQMPFGEMENAEDLQDGLYLMRQRGYRHNINPQYQYSQGCRSMLDRMLDPEPTTRITVTEIMEDAWFRARLPPNTLNYNNGVVRVAEQSFAEIMEVLKQLVPHDLLLSLAHHLRDHSPEAMAYDYSQLHPTHR